MLSHQVQNTWVNIRVHFTSKSRSRSFYYHVFSNRLHFALLAHQVQKHTVASKRGVLVRILALSYFRSRWFSKQTLLEMLQVDLVAPLLIGSILDDLNR